MKNISYLIFSMIILLSCEEESIDFDCSGSNISLEILSIKDAVCGTSTGNIEVSASGGTSPYTFNLDGGSISNSEGIFREVKQGVFKVNVIDANNCSVSKEVTVNASGEVSFSASISRILEANCTLPSCHVPEEGTSRQNLTDFVVVQQLASEIKRRTQNRQMPKEGSITQTEIDLIACWVDGGALDN
jgi:hypothetical protein